MMKRRKYLIKRTNSQNADFIELVELLDQELAIRDGSDHDFYSQFNKIDQIKYAVVAFEKDVAVGCGAIKQLDSNIMEIKRMYTKDDFRGKGIASQILQVLEQWAMDLGINTCMLETGVRQREAIALYEKTGYDRIPNYGQYKNVTNSICFKKELRN